MYKNTKLKMHHPVIIERMVHCGNALFFTLSRFVNNLLYLPYIIIQGYRQPCHIFYQEQLSQQEYRGTSAQKQNIYFF